MPIRLVYLQFAYICVRYSALCDTHILELAIVHPNVTVVHSEKTQKVLSNDAQYHTVLLCDTTTTKHLAQHLEAIGNVTDGYARPFPHVRDTGGAATILAQRALFCDGEAERGVMAIELIKLTLHAATLKNCRH